MPDFTIPGEPETIDAKVADLRRQGHLFLDVGRSLAAITTDGWSGRAADRFRERFELEPDRWRTAGDGFLTAAGALEGWAQALRSARASAQWCREEWARGDRETAAARSAHDADVAAARAEESAWEAANGPGTFTLTIHPFHDPGAAIREGARAEFERARSRLESEAHACASGVRAGCQGAPESRNWLETGLAFVGGVLLGAGEAVWDLGELVVTLSFGPLIDLVDLATGELTPEELAAKKQLQLEMVQGLWTALTTDPWEFGKTVGKSLLDWDTWSDDPARALGHLVPDAVVAVVTAGTATVATRGASTAGALGRHADDIVEGAVDAGRAADRLDDLSDLGRLDDLGDLRHLDDLSGVGGPSPSHLFDPENPYSIRNLLGDDMADAEFWRQRVEAGNEFNRMNHDRFPVNEVRLDNGKVLDSYIPDEAIVSRKHTDLGAVLESTAKGYIDEAVTKYSVGEVVSDTPANRRMFEEAGLEDLLGEPLDGRLRLEVPPHQSIPESILEYARQKGVEIVDPTGRNYSREFLDKLRSRP